MGETDLADIENRIDDYPPQARHDILRLTQELRRLYERDRHKTQLQTSSPLYDPLTGLLNGGAYGVRFAMARARATRFRKIFAVMSINLVFSGAGGRRNPISDAGHDAAIKDVAERLTERVRATDTLARVGEDDFAIILEDMSQSGHAERVKQNVQTALDAPFLAGDSPIAAQASVTMEFYPRPQQSADGPNYH